MYVFLQQYLELFIILAFLTVFIILFIFRNLLREWWDKELRSRLLIFLELLAECVVAFQVRAVRDTERKTTMKERVGVERKVKELYNKDG